MASPNNVWPNNSGYSYNIQPVDGNKTDTHDTLKLCTHHAPRTYSPQLIQSFFPLPVSSAGKCFAHIFTNPYGWSVPYTQHPAPEAIFLSPCCVYIRCDPIGVPSIAKQTSSRDDVNRAIRSSGHLCACVLFCCGQIHSYQTNEVTVFGFPCFVFRITRAVVAAPDDHSLRTEQTTNYTINKTQSQMTESKVY